MATYMGDPRGEVWAQDTNKFGYRMLQRMGWKEGSGLGANEDGITQQIKASNKFDNAGIGLDPKAHLHAWESNTSTFESVLANLNKAYASSSSSKSYTVIAPLSAKPKQETEVAEEKKIKVEKKRTESEEEQEETSVTITQTTTTTITQTQEETTVTEEKPKVFRHLIYSRRLRSKDAANYGKQDLAAILGHGAGKSAQPVVTPSPVLQVEEATDSTLTVSSLGMQDYFKSRLAARETEKNEAHAPVVSQQVEEEEEKNSKQEKPTKDKADKKQKKKKEKKRKRKSEKTENVEDKERGKKRKRSAEDSKKTKKSKKDKRKAKKQKQ